jgi:ATP-dependent Clp protease ATP-binding subunit ClpC
MEKALDKWRSDHLEVPIDVSSDDIARTVSSMSSVPVEKMDVSGTERLLKLESMLEETVVGQPLAVAAIAKALRRSKVFSSAHDRPIGSFLFLGPTGVGKTYLAKMLAEKIFGDSKALIRIDMSEYQEKHSSSRLVGAPPGYVGYDEGGQLTEKVRRRPYSVVLFDEFEKANGDVINVLLQILDDGRLTDGQGRVVDFRNTIVICTANLGFDFARDGKSFGFSPVSAETGYEALKEKLASEAKKTFRPELLNRFDEMIVFNKLGKDEIRRILSIEIDALTKQLSKSGVSLAVQDEALDFIIEKCYDPSLGARPVRRAVQKYVEDTVAEAVLAGKKKKKMTLKLSKDGSSLKF